MKKQSVDRGLHILRRAAPDFAVDLDQFAAVIGILPCDLQELLNGLLVQPGHIEQGFEGPKFLVQIDGPESFKGITHMEGSTFFPQIRQVKTVSVEFDDRVIAAQHFQKHLEDQRLLRGVPGKELCDHPPVRIRALLHGPADHVQLGCGCAKPRSLDIKINDPRRVQTDGGQIFLLTGGGVLLLYHSVLLPCYCTRYALPGQSVRPAVHCRNSRTRDDI